ncbi:hypothetical protein LLG95_07250 [bacterium]|nr:hypothetical protein [bacterium]
MGKIIKLFLPLAYSVMCGCVPFGSVRSNLAKWDRYNYDDINISIELPRNSINIYSTKEIIPFIYTGDGGRRIKGKIISLNPFWYGQFAEPSYLVKIYVCRDNRKYFQSNTDNNRVVLGDYTFNYNDGFQDIQYKKMQMIGDKGVPFSHNAIEHGFFRGVRANDDDIIIFAFLLVSKTTEKYEQKDIASIKKILNSVQSIR